MRRVNARAKRPPDRHRDIHIGWAGRRGVARVGRLRCAGRGFGGAGPGSLSELSGLTCSLTAGLSWSASAASPAVSRGGPLEVIAGVLSYPRSASATSLIGVEVQSCPE